MTDLAEINAAGLTPQSIPFTPSTAIVNSPPRHGMRRGNGGTRRTVDTVDVPSSVYVNPTTVNQNVGQIENNIFNNIQFPSVDTSSVVIPPVSVDTKKITEVLEEIDIGNIFQGFGSLGGFGWGGR